MNDRELLASHRSEDHPTVFFIHRLSNFREQTAEAVMLVGAGVRQKVFRRRSTLLIIGGGISGIAAGLEAAKHGVIVTLFESKPTLFSVQQPCTTRYLHPYEYEWPLAHYTAKSFPFTERDKQHCPEQMRWTAGAASKVSKKLAKQVLTEAPLNMNLSLGVNHIPVSQDTLLDNFDPDGEYEFILVCAGALERTKVEKSRFASFPYWSQDPLENICSQHKSGHPSTKIILLGGGDGGLQDLLRIVTLHPKRKLFSAGHFIETLLPALRRSSEFVDWLQIKQNGWSAYRPDPTILWEDLDILLDSLRANPRCWNYLTRVVRRSIHPAVVSGNVVVQLAFRGARFSKAFALNVFLVQLLIRVVEEHQWLLPEREVDFVESAAHDHLCAGVAADCFNHLHTVYWKTSCTTSNKKSDFDVIVFRLGSDQMFSVGP